MSVSESRGWTRSCPVTTSWFVLLVQRLLRLLYFSPNSICKPPPTPNPHLTPEPQARRLLHKCVSVRWGVFAQGTLGIFLSFFLMTQITQSVLITRSARGTVIVSHQEDERASQQDPVWKEEVEEEAGVPGSTFSSRYVFTSLPG